MSKTQWLTIDHKTFVEVTPYKDAREHNLGDECWCQPTVEKTRGVPLITHHRHQHSFGPWKDAEPVVIGGEKKLVSLRFCRECPMMQPRIGSLK
jgi:hypothetical protein